MTGLSATPWRRDQLTQLIFWHVGDVTHSIEKDGLMVSGDVLPADVIIRETDFESFSDPATEYTQMLSKLTKDENRNRLIVSDVVDEAANPDGIILILSDRKKHCEDLQRLISEEGIRAEILTGDVANGERKRIVEDLSAGKIKILIATGQLIGEGFDCKELSTLFLTTPIKFDGRLIQYLGRVLRPAPGKARARVFDYVDTNIEVLRASAASRRRIFEAIG